MNTKTPDVTASFAEGWIGGATGVVQFLDYHLYSLDGLVIAAGAVYLSHGLIHKIQQLNPKYKPRKVNNVAFAAGLALPYLLYSPQLYAGVQHALAPSAPVIPTSCITPAGHCDKSGKIRKISEGPTSPNHRLVHKGQNYKISLNPA